MLNPWELPKTAVIGGKTYGLHTDFRDILQIFTWLEREELPEFVRWQVALGLFYEGSIPEEVMLDAISFLAEFIRGGQEQGAAGPKLMDWQLDADVIVADVNKAAGVELRQLPYVHWWTFLGWFRAIGPGQLSSLVSVREAVRKGKKLEPWQQDYFRENRSRVLMQKPLSAGQQQQKQRLEALLNAQRRERI